jgi:2-oxoglutarate dehydrogenase E1 component
MPLENEFHGPNLGYILALYEQYREDPGSVDESTRKLFEQWSPADATSARVTSQNLPSLTGAANLAQAIRIYGYLSANLDPLDDAPDSSSNPLLTPEFHKISEEDLVNIHADVANLPEGQASRNAREAIEVLRSIYCGTIGYDYGHVHVPEERQWLFQAAESRRLRPPVQSLDGEKLLERLTQVEAFEVFLHRLYPGKTRFSIEGLDMLIPILDEIIANAAQETICVALIGMAHRGRLNVLAHILQKPYSQILAEFADPQGRATTWDELGWTGDVKYHMGAHRSPRRDQKVDMLIHMPPNPSHLEMVDPVVVGMGRAANSKVDVPGAPRYFSITPRYQSLSMGMPRLPVRASWQRRSTSRACRATASAARYTSSPITSWASPPTNMKRAAACMPATWQRDSRCRSSTSTRMTRSRASRRHERHLPIVTNSTRIS